MYNKSLSNAHKKTNLDDKISAPEVCNCPGQPRPSPDKSQEERSLLIGELFQNIPEPID